MSLPVVLVDLDGVVGDFVSAYLRVYHEYAGTTAMSTPPVCTWNFDAMLSNQTAVKAAWRDPRIFAEQVPYPGAIAGLDMLCKHFDCLAVTAPGLYLDSMVPAKVRWLRQHAPFLAPQQILFTPRKGLVHGDALVDDYHENVLTWKRAHPFGRAILVARPWNEMHRDKVRAAGGIVVSAELDGIAAQLIASGIGGERE